MDEMTHKSVLDEVSDSAPAPGRPPRRGPVETATRAALAELDLAGRDAVLAEAAYTLASKLDNDAGMAAAAVSKELRATLDQIWQGQGGGGEDDDYGPA